ncbi:hypothetical protein KUL25_12390 [Rhodobacteraceae bacterium N5(2021)]|uniref:MFS transporter n=1 Tax=Gymnodinialimonas phycosphaerae TaxID=2841589 RepID=A0A975YEE1_9RHOB|nr:hypothetical protein [Gymnodinialimonas phycosphaerae]MBY4893561.1 hypothetical protein [Gymnodinialimonas phycosphaerae]
MSVAFVCFCAGGLYGWSALIAPLQQAFDVSTVQTGLVFSIAIVCFTLAVAVVPSIAAKTPPLRRLALFSWAGVVSLMLASVAPSYALFVVCFSAGFGTFSGAIYISAVAIAAQSRHPMRATPLMVAAFGIGGAVFGPAWRLMEEEAWGLIALWPLAVALCLGGVAVWFLPDRTPPDSKESQIGEGSRPVAIDVQGWVWLVFTLGSFGGLMVLGLAAKILDVAGASIARSSVALAGVALGNTLGRLSVIGLSHYLSPIAGLFISLGIGASGLLLTQLASAEGLLAAGLCLIAVGYGVMASAIPTLTRSLYGPSRFQQRFALIFTGWGLAGFCAPWVAGWSFDTTGSFELAVYLAIGATGVAFIGAIALHIRLAKTRGRPPQRA